MPGEDVMFELVEIETEDGVLLQGLGSPSRSRKLALIYVHGLGGDFYGSPKKVRAFASACLGRGFGFFIFNNRGNNTLTGAKRLDRSSKGYRYVKAGRCYERFEDCIYDIRAMAREALARGYGRVGLVGHSTGANKVVYYLSKARRGPIAGAVLTGPVSDVPLQMELCGRRYPALVKKARAMVLRGKGVGLMPAGTPGEPISARRFLSLSVPGSPEDVFQYHMEKPRYSALKKVKVPLLAILGGKDEYAMMRPETILSSYREANPRVETMLVPGVGHSFTGAEEMLAGAVCGWFSGLRLQGIRP
jgi:pimeloyl-ACP methyl ester carboxylesterase